MPQAKKNILSDRSEILSEKTSIYVQIEALSPDRQSGYLAFH